MTKSPEYVEWQARCFAAQEEYQEARRVLWETLSAAVPQYFTCKGYEAACRRILPEYVGQRAKLYKKYLAACGKPPKGA